MNDNGAASCACISGYAGTPCANIDDCAMHGCVNGECVDGLNMYTCACESGWQGELCDEDVDECAANDMLCGDPLSQGACENSPPGSYTCSCLAGYSGDNCEIVDYCVVDPCNGHGVCTSGASSYTCACNAGYTGSDCELLAPEFDFLTELVGATGTTGESYSGLVRAVQFQLETPQMSALSLTRVVISGLPPGSAATAKLFLIKDSEVVPPAATVALGNPLPGPAQSTTTTATFNMSEPLTSESYHSLVVMVDSDQTWDLLEIPSSAPFVYGTDVNVGPLYGWFGGAQFSCTNACVSDANAYPQSYGLTPQMTLSFEEQP
jgi:hypothetical protein